MLISPKTDMPIFQNRRSKPDILHTTYYTLHPVLQKLKIKKTIRIDRGWRRVSKTTTTATKVSGALLNFRETKSSWAGSTPFLNSKIEQSWLNSIFFLKIELSQVSSFFLCRKSNWAGSTRLGDCKKVPRLPFCERAIHPGNTISGRKSS